MPPLPFKYIWDFLTKETKLIDEEYDDGIHDHGYGCNCRNCNEIRAARATANPAGWASDDQKRFRTYSRIEKSLPSGVYRFVKLNGVPHFFKIDFPSDDAVSLPGLPSDYILNQIKDFWATADEFKKFGLIHKRGILMYGPPGCGKTSIIRLLCDQVLKLGGIAFCIDSFESAGEFARVFRSAEPDRPILMIEEDVENVFSGNSAAEEIKAALSFLDGQDQVNNIVHIATTNNPEQMADKFIKRPGRYDLVIGVFSPTAETREAYLRHVAKGQLPEEKIKEIVEKTEGLGLAYLRELLATNLCLGIPLDETLKRIRDNFKSKKLSNKQMEQSMGFEIGFKG